MLTLAAWLHTLDPYAVMLWEGGPIRWYGLSYLAGFLLGWLLIRRVCRVGISTLPPERAADLVITLALFGVIGGRLGYVIFYRPELLLTFTNRLPFWGALDLMGGGMSSHGGILGAALGTAWFAWRQKQPWLYVMDLLAFGAPLGLMCGRLANFINGELLGRRCDADFPLAVQFPQELYDDPDLFRRFEAAAHVQGVTTIPRDLLGAIQSGYPGLQEAAKMVLPFRHPSQLYAAAGEGLLVFLVLALLWMKPRPRGLVAGAFAITYSLMRLADEYFRLPDAHLGLRALGLSRGQWLTLPLLALGVVLIAWAVWKRPPLVGGWRGVGTTAEGERRGGAEKAEKR